MDERRGRPLLLVAGLAVALVALIAVGARAFVNPRSDVEQHATEPVARVDPNAVYDPVAAGEELPEGYLPLVPRDVIEPVYDPVFTAASNVEWPRDSLVVGIAGEETAKAYPVTHLNSREMVIDSLEGIPILVTW